MTNVVLNSDHVYELAKFIVAHNGQKKIESIKDLRAITGFDLRTSKDIIWLLTPKSDDDMKSEVRNILDGKSSYC